MDAAVVHPIPDAALDADLAVLAQKGAGKTYMVRGLVERLLDMGRRVVILDPLDTWWGLKATAGGAPGYPVVVIGGPHQDLPLDPAAGERLGDYLAKADVSAVIDTSELRRGEMLTFCAAFLRALYRTNREALWLVLEEADVFAPQQPMKDATFLLHEVEQIARRGRSKGFRLFSITQRPARLHKDVLTQASTLALLRIRSPQDRDAVDDWVRGNADANQARTVADSLASLETGEGWVWAPDHDLLARVRFPKIKTLDTSFTPKAGERRPMTPELAKVDLAGLRELLTAKAAPAARASGEGLRAEYERGLAVGREQGFVDGVMHMKLSLKFHFGSFVDQMAADADPAPQPTPPEAAPAPDSRPPAPVAHDPPPEGLARPQSHLLGVLVAAERPFGPNIDKVLLAFLAEVSHRSSGYANNLGSLRSMGLIDYPAGGMVCLTDRGRAAGTIAGGKAGFRFASTDDAVQRMVLAKLSRPQQAIMEALLEEHPRDMSRQALAERAGASANSSGFANNLGALRSLGLIDYPTGGRVAVTELLFPYHLARQSA